MVNTVKSIDKVIGDDNKLLSLLISILFDRYGATLGPKKIKELLEKDFNFIVSLEEIDKVFEPSINDMQEDLHIQSKNLGIIYE